MTKQLSLPTLRRYLLIWFGGTAIAMVIAYTALLEHYLELGITLRTQSFLERTAQSYEEALRNGIEITGLLKFAWLKKL